MTSSGGRLLPSPAWLIAPCLGCRALGRTRQASSRGTLPLNRSVRIGPVRRATAVDTAGAHAAGFSGRPRVITSIPARTWSATRMSEVQIGRTWPCTRSPKIDRSRHRPRGAERNRRSDRSRGVSGGLSAGRGSTQSGGDWRASHRIAHREARYGSVYVVGKVRLSPSVERPRRRRCGTRLAPRKPVPEGSSMARHGRWRRPGRSRYDALLGPTA